MEGMEGGRGWLHETHLSLFASFSLSFFLHDSLFSICQRTADTPDTHKNAHTLHLRWAEQCRAKTMVWCVMNAQPWLWISSIKHCLRPKCYPIPHIVHYFWPFTKTTSLNNRVQGGTGSICTDTKQLSFIQCIVVDLGKMYIGNGDTEIVNSSRDVDCIYITV